MTKIKSRDFYLFKAGAYIWFAGLSAQEKKVEIRKHGAIIHFVSTN